MKQDTPDEIHRGYREFVGGDGKYWDDIGQLQFRFLVERGLSRSDVLIDVGCGSLRGGVHFIRHLDPEGYLGIDKHVELIIYGVAQELGLPAFAAKRPQFVISSAFEFDKFTKPCSFAIAQSLFTHLVSDDIRTCLSRLRAVASPDCQFFATFFETDARTANASVSHSHDRFAYTRQEMEPFGTATGWAPDYVGDWGHPREQRMMRYVAPR